MESYAGDGRMVECGPALILFAEVSVSPQLNQAFEFAIETARAAGDLLRDYWQRGVTAEYQAPIDVVTESDRASQRLILGRIRRSYPDHAFLFAEMRVRFLHRSPHP